MPDRYDFYRLAPRDETIILNNPLKAGRRVRSKRSR